jgi:hypothetical protein
MFLLLLHNIDVFFFFLEIHDDVSESFHVRLVRTDRDENETYRSMVERSVVNLEVMYPFLGLLYVCVPKIKKNPKKFKNLKLPLFNGRTD